MGNKLLMTDKQIYTANQGGFLCLKDWQVMRVFFFKVYQISNRHKKRASQIA